MDSPYTGKGVAFSSTNLVEAGVGGVSAKDHKRFEAATEHCPIEHSFASHMPVSAHYSHAD